MLPSAQKRPVWVRLTEQRRILWSKAEALGRMHQKWSLLSERSLLTLQKGGVREAEVDATLALFTSARRERERDLAAFQRAMDLEERHNAPADADEHDEDDDGENADDDDVEEE